MPESDFEGFVREALEEVRTNCAHMADALWDLIPRVKKLERVQDRHAEMLRDHAALLKGKVESVPPPKNLGTQTDTGSWKFTDAELTKWQKQKDGERWAAMWAGSWKIVTAVLATVIGSEILHKVILP